MPRVTLEALRATAEAEDAGVFSFKIWDPMKLAACRHL